MITTFLRFDIATYRSPAAKASAAARVPAVTRTNDVDARHDRPRRVTRCHGADVMRARITS
jgi:hypothetical protein